MSIRNTLLGGVDFSTPTARIKPTDLNDTFDASALLGISAFNTAALNHVRQLIDRGVSYSKDMKDLYGEAYVDSNGRNNSVDTVNTNAVFDTDKYKFRDSITEIFSGSNSGANTTSFTYNIDINTECIFTSFKQNSDSGTVTISIIENGETIASKSSSVTGDQLITFIESDYSRPLESGQTAIIQVNTTSGSLPLDKTNSFVSTDNALFSISSQQISCYNAGNYEIIAETVTVLTENIITYNIPAGTFSSNCNRFHAKAMVEDYEEGCNIQHKIISSNININGFSANDKDTYVLKKTIQTNAILEDIEYDMRTVYGSKTGYCKFIITYSDLTTYEQEDSTSSTSFVTKTVNLDNTKIVNTIMIYLKQETIDTGEAVIVDSFFIEFLNKSDSGWVDDGLPIKFTSFASEPTQMITKLIPKTTSPTPGVPSVKGVGYKVE